MAETRKKTTTTKPKTTTAKATETVAAPAASTAAKKIVAKDVDEHQYIPVLSGFHGMLIYVSRRTGEEFRWDEFGTEQDIELMELRNAKSSAKGFFINNWFLFRPEDDWVIDYLGVRQYYKHALTADGFDSLFSKTPEEIEEITSQMSEGQKRSAAYRARQLITEGKIDSHKVITALEKCLNVELVER